jgi:hypothetical protein
MEPDDGAPAPWDMWSEPVIEGAVGGGDVAPVAAVRRRRLGPSLDESLAKMHQNNRRSHATISGTQMDHAAKIVSDTHKLMSDAAAEAISGISRKKLADDKMAYAEEYVTSFLIAFRIFRRGLVALIKAKLWRLIGENTDQMFDETPLLCQVEELTGKNVAHVLQVQLSTTLVIEEIATQEPLELTVDFPIHLVPMDGTSGEVSFHALCVTCDVWQTEIDILCAEAAEEQDEEPIRSKTATADSAGSNDRTLREAAFYHGVKLDTRHKCDAHMLHKPVLEMMKHLKGIIGSMSKALGSMVMSGTVKQMREKVEEFFFSRLTVDAGHSAWANQMLFCLLVVSRLAVSR